ncbi:mitochondrial glycine transporter B-like isoform X2 [Ctenocephalides felis]|uniref:mitochondrial glycine transporter B-like isoform X2 n=1 Tax=Ctenocephalides felis TaxID=7515 RepID=UPI000E6E26EB|nr:mitochondrial glycine transporter B-like isoform X2 [Ctenocephalides felis]
MIPRSCGMVTVLTTILKKEQLLALWTGITPSITRCVPGVGLYFSALHWLKSQTLVNENVNEPTPLQAVALGVAARTMSGAALIPITVIKTRYESGVYNYASMTQALTIIWRTEGLRGLCCGLTATLVRDAPFSGLYLMFYTQSKQAIPQDILKSPYASCVHFTCGVTAGILASAVTHPADVIKTQMQLYPDKFTSVLRAMGHINHTMGVSGYFRGLAPRMLRRTLMAAMAWTVYEQITLRMGLK